MFGLSVFITQYSVFITQYPNFVGPTASCFVWMSFHHSKNRIKSWKMKIGFTCFHHSKSDFSGMFVNKRRLWAPKASHIPLVTLSFLSFLSFFLFFSLSSPLFFLSLFFFICSSSEQKAHTQQPLTRIAFFLLSSDSLFFVLLPPVTHMLTHAHPSREIIDVDLQSHTEKLHHAFILLLVAIALILQSGRSVKIGIHSNDLLGIHSNDQDKA